ncbi:hypothetical protein [Winogradskyella flava]|uniref:Uncharacterized protein n=1 Tax=Winogradskyella flava TaxID=1884876 RepID=A0A842IMG0_9FLAO|nr:hypothetical protein [Winogradskyella flava]MBC2843835.1 hypothetical protein [Winogradskyella flava]
MKLTNSQIQELYTFTQKHYVEWFDVQTELVDHLANGIEAQWQENQKISFDDALKAEFKKFGIMGFSNVIEEKTKALNSYYRNLVWTYFKDFFKLPKIILTLLSTWLFFEILQLTPNKNWIVIPAFTILFIVPTVFFINVAKRIRKTEYVTNKKWLFESINLQLGGLIHILSIPLYTGVFFESIDKWPILFQVICSIVIVLLGMLIYISIFIVSPKLRIQMAKQHPDYKFV